MFLRFSSADGDNKDINTL